MWGKGLMNASTVSRWEMMLFFLSVLRSDLHSAVWRECHTTLPISSPQTHFFFVWCCIDIFFSFVVNRWYRWYKVEESVLFSCSVLWAFSTSTDQFSSIQVYSVWSQWCAFPNQRSNFLQWVGLSEHGHAKPRFVEANIESSASQLCIHGRRVLLLWV